MPTEKPKSALELVKEATAMLSAGAYQSSYEGLIIEKLRDAMHMLEHQSTFLVEFTVMRADLLSLCGAESSYRHAMTSADDSADGVSNKTLFSRLLQYSLYDSDDGPQIMGDYRIIEKEEG